MTVEHYEEPLSDHEGFVVLPREDDEVWVYGDLYDRWTVMHHRNGLYREVSFHNNRAAAEEEARRYSSYIKTCC